MQHLDVTPRVENLLCCVCKQLLAEPVLLQCLHSCCKRCLGDRAVLDECLALDCPQCQQVTRLDEVKGNEFLAHQIAVLRKLAIVNRCAACALRGDEQAIASTWCADCQMSMCRRCLAAHELLNLHELVDLEANGTAFDEIRSSMRSHCSRHERPLELACTTCQTVLCLFCAGPCFKEAHGLQLVKDSSTGHLFVEAASRVQQSRAVLEKTSEPLMRHERISRQLDLDLADQLNMLQAVRDSIIDAVSRAFENTQMSLEACYKSLYDRSAVLSSSNRSLQNDVSHALEYSSRLLSEGDPADVYSQEQLLSARMQYLADELDRTEASRCSTLAVELIDNLPADVDSIVSKWFGTPRLVTRPMIRQDRRADREEELTEPEVDFDFSQLTRELAEDEPFSSDEVDTLSLDTTTMSGSSDGGSAVDFRLPDQFWDIAVSSEGTLLLAGRELGLREYSVAGFRLSSWSPPRVGKDEACDWVTTVDVTRDGRVVVDNVHLRRVVLLRRGRDERHRRGSSGSTDARGRGASDDDDADDACCDWVQERIVATCSSQLFKLSVHLDTLVLAETSPFFERAVVADVAENALLRLLRLGDGAELLRLELPYDVKAAALTDLCVVVAGTKRKTIGAPPGLSVRHVVCGYSRDGVFVWEQEVLYGVLDICTSPSLPQLCLLALGDGRRPIAINYQNGRCEDCVLLNIGQPCKMSVGGKDDALVAILTDKNRTVRVISASSLGHASGCYGCFSPPPLKR